MKTLRMSDFVQVGLVGVLIVLVLIAYDSWQKRQQLHRAGRPLPPLQQSEPLIPESEKPVPVAAPEPEAEPKEASLSPERYLMLYQDRAQMVKAGEVFRLNDGKALTIGSQPVSFQAIEGTLLAYKYDDPTSTGRRPVVFSPIATADIEVLDGLRPGQAMGDAIIGDYVIHVLSGSLHECRYVAEERTD